MYNFVINKVMKTYSIPQTIIWNLGSDCLMQSTDIISTQRGYGQQGVQLSPARKLYI